MKSRRNFIQKTAVIRAGIITAPSFTYGMFKANENEKLNVGMIGVGLRGTNHLNNLLMRKDVNVTAICDVDPSRICGRCGTWGNGFLCNQFFCSVCQVEHSTPIGCL